MTANHNVIDLLCDLIALPSVNPEHRRELTEAPYGEKRVADYVQRYFGSFGVTIERQEALPGRENVLVHVPGKDPAALPVLLQAHMDTVDVQGMDEPFTPRVEDDRIYGRGACDTKGSLAAMMMAVKQLLEEDVLPPRGCVLVAGADEEFRMSGSAILAKCGMRFVGAIVGEPTSLDVVPATNGQMYFRIKVRGKAAHTSIPQTGINAIYLMNDVITMLRRRVDSEYRWRRHSLCGQPQLTVSLINGGTSEHVVPDACEISLDRRIIPGESGEEALAEIKTWLADDLDSGTYERVEVELLFKNVPPVDTPLDHPVVRGLCSAAESVLGEARIVGVPYNTDASNLSEGGTSCVVFGPGDIAHAHSIVEFVEVKQLTAAVEILKRFLLADPFQS